MMQAQSELDSINNNFDPRKDCCTTCMTGGRDLQLNDKLHRQAMWLRVLLRRKGRTSEIEALEAKFGKAVLDSWQKTGGKRP